jgi:hypothetical protein
MAAGDSYVLFAGDEVWRVRSGGAVDEVRFERGAGAKEVAAAVTAKLRGRGYQGQGVLLALPAAWCLSAVISTADLPRQDRAAMAFRLEEKLPLAAENFTADFVPLADGRALGVCVANERVVSLVEALEGAGGGGAVGHPRRHPGGAGHRSPQSRQRALGRRRWNQRDRPR